MTIPTQPSIVNISHSFSPDPSRLRGFVASALNLTGTEQFTVSDANRGRGVFSTVVRVSAGERSVVVKSPAIEAAVTSGACQREAYAYQHLLPQSPIGSPRVHLIAHYDDTATEFVLEDLGPHRQVSQLDGLEADDVFAIVDELKAFHQYWQDDDRLGSITVRRSAPSGIHPPDNAVDIPVFAAVRHHRQRLIEAFDDGPPTLCHGDPRADNIAFGPSPIFFDWQQIAIQPGYADLAWLAATSIRPELRRELDHSIAARYGMDFDSYRKGFVLPGLAVQMLASRPATDSRTKAMVAMSLERIGAALQDLDVV